MRNNTGDTFRSSKTLICRWLAHIDIFSQGEKGRRKAAFKQGYLTGRSV